MYKKPKVIAEIGCNHTGDIKIAFELIDLAKDSGADVVKFQCFSPEKYVSVEEKKYSKIKKFYFNKNQFDELILVRQNLYLK